MTQPLERTESKLETLASRVEERHIGPCRILVLKTPVASVVSWRGSFLTQPGFAQGEELVQVLTVDLLDKGTQDHDRFELAEIVDNRGAQLSFSSERLRVSVQGRALRDDVATMLNLLAEEVRRPVFHPDEFEKARIQYRSGLQRALENTSSQASAALSRRIYAPAHPNYTPPADESLAQLDGLEVDDVRRYHKTHFGANACVLVLVGDVEMDSIAPVVETAFADWMPGEVAEAFAAQASPQPPGRSEVPMPGKMNVDVQFGHALPIRRHDPDYVPLFVANHMLGGNFSARLMTHVRDELGLTYGIYSTLSGITTEYAGHWKIGVTLSSTSVEAGMAATLAAVRRFVEEGPTEEELRDVKTTITGSFKVGLATTSGLAAVLHRNAVRGFGVDYLDQFPAEVEALTLDDVTAAIQRHFNPDQFQTALAGSLEAL